MERFNHTLVAMLSKVVAPIIKRIVMITCKMSFLLLFMTQLNTHHSLLCLAIILAYCGCYARTYATAEEETATAHAECTECLKDAFSSVRQQPDAAHQRQTLSADQTSTGESQFQVGDIVWLYVPAVKSGLSRRLSSL